MVRACIAFCLFFSFSFAMNSGLYAQESSSNDPVIQKIKSFLDEKTFNKNKDFINIIFEPKSAYYKNDRVNALSVVKTLKENGLLKLFFASPREFQLNFKTSGSPLFFVKIMSDTLRNIGYYRYVTSASHLDESEFNWSINLSSEYATDPLVLQKELQKSGCNIIDIERNSAQEWTYSIDMSRAYLNIPSLRNAKEVQLKRSLYEHWLDVSHIEELTIKSSSQNQWYPYIAYYDSSLHLLKIIKENEISKGILLEIPKNAKYIKISDLYTLKNVRDELELFPSGSR